jgi:hypothetical protein
VHCASLKLDPAPSGLSPLSDLCARCPTGLAQRRDARVQQWCRCQAAGDGCFPDRVSMQLPLGATRATGEHGNTFVRDLQNPRRTSRKGSGGGESRPRGCRDTVLAAETFSQGQVARKLAACAPFCGRLLTLAGVPSGICVNLGRTLLAVRFGWRDPVAGGQVANRRAWQAQGRLEISREHRGDQTLTEMCPSPLRLTSKVPKACQAPCEARSPRLHYRPQLHCGCRFGSSPASLRFHWPIGPGSSDLHPGWRTICNSETCLLTSTAVQQPWPGSLILSKRSRIARTSTLITIDTARSPATLVLE